MANDVFDALKGSRVGKLLVFSGPSGAGKTTICKMLLNRVEYLVFSISHTTRPMRRGEIDGRDYFFVNADEFEELSRGGTFAEEAVVHGYRYGTAREFLERRTEAGFDVLLDIDVRGAEQIADAYGTRAVTIFVVPPSFEVLAARLKGRGTDAPEELAVRVENARAELDKFVDYKYYLVNDELDRCVRQAENIIRAERQLVTSLLERRAAK